MKMKSTPIALAVALALLTACTPEPTTTTTTAPEVAKTETPVTAQSESDKANAYFEQVFMEQVNLSPESLTQLGIKQKYDQWDAFTDEAADALLALTKATISRFSRL